MISNLDQEAWDKKVIEQQGSILQSWNWGQFMQALGHQIFRFSGNNFLAQAVKMTLPFGKSYIYSPRGPLGSAQDALPDFKQLASDRSLIFVRLEPQQELNLPRSIKETQPMHNWMVDISQQPEQLLIQMKPKTRYNINLAQKKGVVVREGDKKDLLDVYKLLMETAGRAGFRLHPQNYYWQMYETLDPNFLKILIAEHKGRPLAAMILTLFGTTATYLHGGSSPFMREAMAPYLLHWEAMRLAKGLGFTTYDFGGISDDAKNHPTWVGLTRFKKGFGGYEVVYPGSFDLAYSSIWYNVYKNARVLGKILRKTNAI